MGNYAALCHRSFLSIVRFHFHFRKVKVKTKNKKTHATDDLSCSIVISGHWEAMC